PRPGYNNSIRPESKENLFAKCELSRCDRRQTDARRISPVSCRRPRPVVLMPRAASAPMADLSELGSILVSARVVSRAQWDRAATKAKSAGAGTAIDALLAALTALAAEPPYWWDNKPPTPRGLTEYQQAVIRSRFVDDELEHLRRDLALNQFLLLGKLGQGGQGEVFRSRQLNPPRYAAVKTLIRDTDARRRRFEHEARAMMKIQHPAVARFYLYERVRDAQGAPTDEYLIAMEFVSGIVLHRLVHRIGAIPWKFAVHWCIGLLGGLDVIHQNGFVHGDVKPENVMVMGPVPAANVKVEATAAKLLDFGAAKRVDRADDDAEQKRTFVGTPQYAPPEQWKAEVVPASDLYALGGSMFYMLTGRFPYQKDRRDPQAYRDSHIHDPVLEVRDFNDSVPAEVSAVMRQMMAKKADERGTAEELIAAFKATLPKDAYSTPVPATRPPLSTSSKARPAIPPAPAAAPINAEPETIPN